MKKNCHTFFKKISYCFFGLVFFLISPSIFANNVHFAKDKNISFTDIGMGQPIVFIHAFPTDQNLWKPQQDGLKKYFRVITLDLWGFGQSETTDGTAVTMTEYGDEVKQLLDQLHIQKAIIAGESMGGYIALAFLEKYPNNTTSLILSDTQSIADSEEAKAKREKTAVDVLENGSANLINGFMPKALSSDAPEDTKSFLLGILKAQKTTGIASALRGMALRHDTSYLLAESTLPILILTGDKDTLISPQQSGNMNALAKNSKLVVISNAAHLSSLEKPEQWNQAVVDMFYESKLKT